MRCLWYNSFEEMAMSVVRIEKGFRIRLPDELRKWFRVGDKVQVRTDAAGHVILRPSKAIDQILAATAGLWADRTDIPVDGVAYVDQIRYGTRLQELGLAHG